MARKTYTELVKSGSQQEWREWIKAASIDELLEVLPDVQFKKEPLALIEAMLKIRLAEPHWKPVILAAISALAATCIAVVGAVNAASAWASRSQTQAQMQVLQANTQGLSNTLSLLQANQNSLSSNLSSIERQITQKPPTTNHP